jgi:hypothetical protein
MRIQVEEVGSLHSNEIMRGRWLTTGKVNADLYMEMINLPSNTD